MAYIILQSCTLPQHNLQKFTHGNLVKLKTLSPVPAQPERIFYGDDGTPVSLQDFRGQYVLLNVWATWCAPCVAEIPSLEALQGEYADKNLVVVAVSMDRHSVDGESFFKTKNIKHLKFYHDPSFSMAADVGERGLPISIFYDKSGVEIARVPGEVDWQSQEVKAFLGHIITLP